MTDTEHRELILVGGEVALVDAADYPLLAQWPWRATRSSRRTTQYVYRNSRAENGERVFVLMHRHIMNCTERTTQVDHINRNGLDNRRSNLRIATTRQNSGNTRKRVNGQTSMYKGVHWDELNGCWRAQIRDGKKRNLGGYRDAESAARAYDAAARRIFGEFALCNFPDETSGGANPLDIERRKPLPSELTRQLAEARAQSGDSLRAIGARFGVSATAVVKACKRHGGLAR